MSEEAENTEDTKEDKEKTPKKAKSLPEVISYVNEEQMQKDLMITDATVRKCIAKNPGMIAYYGGLYAKSQKQLDYFKDLLLTYENARYDEAREALSEDAGPRSKPTETQIKTWIGQLPKHRVLRRLVRNAEFECQMAKRAYEAFRDRTSLLVTLGNMDRDERKSRIEKFIKDS